METNADHAGCATRGWGWDAGAAGSCCPRLLLPLVSVGLGRVSLLQSWLSHLSDNENGPFTRALLRIKRKPEGQTRVGQLVLQGASGGWSGAC